METSIPPDKEKKLAGFSKKVDKYITDSSTGPWAQIYHTLGKEIPRLQLSGALENILGKFCITVTIMYFSLSLQQGIRLAQNIHIK